GGSLVLGYRREDFVRETLIAASAEEAELGEDGVSFRVKLPAHGEWTTCIDALPHAGRAPRPKHGHGSIHEPLPNMRESLEEWIEQAPKVESGWDKLGHI